MSKKVLVIVPVSPTEPDYVVINSAKSVKGLDLKGFDAKVVYVIDVNRDSLVRFRKVKGILESFGFEVLMRKGNHGKKAGAINFVLDRYRDYDPDYIVIFDVDTRPAKNFVKECIKALESDDRAYIASTPRYVNNMMENLVTEIIGLEYKAFNFFMKKLSFKNFNGPIGVIRARMMSKMNENSIAEDLDFSIRMYTKGFNSVLTERSYIYEQAPMTWRDLFNQRRRWYYGGLEVIKSGKIFKKRSFGAKILAITVLCHVPLLFIPLAIAFSPVILYKFKKPRILFGIITYFIVNQLAAISSLCNFLMGREIEWKAVKRAKL